MKLVPKARPVRIRIKSSGEEHSSFDSLKRSLCFEDLRESACDGRLSNWLRQQDKQNVAERIEEIKTELAADEVNEETYLKFFIAIFCDDVDEQAITSKSDLYDWWGKTRYNQGWEFEKLKNEVIESRLQANKANDNKKMKQDYSYALKFYKDHQESRTQTEWEEIFFSHEIVNENDCNYWWFLYQLTQKEFYLTKAFAKGHAEAKDLVERSKDRFANITKGNFKLVLSNRLPRSFAAPCNISSAKDLIRQVKAKSEADSELKNELTDILTNWERILAGGGDTQEALVNDAFKNSQYKYLEPEKYFIQGLFREMISKDSMRHYAASTKLGYLPAKRKLEQLSKGISSCRALNYHGDQVESSFMTFGNRTRENKAKVGIILSFIIRHLFDTYDV